MIKLLQDFLIHAYHIVYYFDCKMCNCVSRQVFSVLNCAVAQDSSAEVRRAAVLVVTMLLQGLGGDALKVGVCVCVFDI